jgi:1,4-alpha-glucan branching enzyme
MIRKVTILQFLGVLFSIFSAKADILIEIPEVTSTPGIEITIPVKIYGASEAGTPIAGAQIDWTFDSTAVKFLGFTNFNPLTPPGQWQYTGNNNTGRILSNWLEPSLQGVAFPDGSTLYEVRFLAKPGTCDFTYLILEFIDPFLSIVPSSGDPGSYASIQQVTFQVDLRDQSVSSNGVHLSGSFNGWSETATPMTLAFENVYSATVPLIFNSDCFYKFVNGNDTTGYETVPSGCGVVYGNTIARFLEIPAGDTTLPDLCFSSCDTCPAQTPVTFRVDMSQQTVSQNGVHIAGTFNNWDPDATVMNNLGNNIFGVTIPLTSGVDAEYRFVNGNTTAGYEIVPAECGVPAGSGVYNRFLTVPDNDTTLLAVCFSNCDECLTLHSVTFKVDMSETAVSPDGVHLAGSFNAFNPTSIEMTNQGNDVFIATIDLLQNEFTTYRFVNGDDASGFEIVPPECGIDNGSGIFNRFLTVPAQDTVLAEVCFSSCDDCTQQPFEKDVTFQVDMTREAISAEGIHLAGTFNGWNPLANPLIEISENIYSTTLTLNENDIHQYLFVNGNTSGGYETVPAACGYSGTTGGLERQIIIPAADTILPAVCFASCSPCVVHQVTLRVDMMEELVSVNGVHVAGSFNGWNPGEIEMTSAGSSVYEVSIPVYEGDTLLYRFVNGNETGDMESVPSDCGWLYNGADYARIVIPLSDTTLEAVCFSSCDPCDIGLPEAEDIFKVGNLFPNPAMSFVRVPLVLDEPAEIRISILNNLGVQVFDGSYSLGQGYQDLTLPTAGFPDGIYFLRAVRTTDGVTDQTIRKFIVKKT